MKELFLIALLKKYRFQTSQGLLTMEDLITYDITLLKNLYQELQESVVKVKTLSGRKKDNTDKLNKIQIVEIIYDYRSKREEESTLRKNNRILRERMLEHADEKELEEMLAGKSSKQIRKEAAKLR